MHTINLWLINGPPRSGKDSVGTIAQEYLSREERYWPVATQAKFATAVKNATHAAMCGFRDVYWDSAIMDGERYNSSKDDADEWFFGVTPRQAYIQMSEGFAKPLWGSGIFGHLMAREVWQAWDKGYDHILITDCGFQAEVETLLAELAQRQIKAVPRLVTVKRPGTSYEGDSRSEVTFPNIGHLIIENDGTMNDLRQKVHTMLDKVLAEAVVDG